MGYSRQLFNEAIKNPKIRISELEIQLREVDN